MYPATYFGLFPAFPRNEKVFVAMSFDHRFDSRWTDVIQKAIRSVKRNGTALEPYRVDSGIVSDSLLTEILDGISNARLFLADVTSLNELDGRPIRNENVLYEVGIAHAVRQPQEVLLFRSDNAPLLFDLANVRVNSYDPDGNPEEAIRKVGTALVQALTETDQKRNLAVKAAAEALDFDAWECLQEALGQGGITTPVITTLGRSVGDSRRLAAISRLLQMGALTTGYVSVTPEFIVQTAASTPMQDLMKYYATAFGEAVLMRVAENMGMLSPEVQELQKNLPEDESSAKAGT